MQTNGLYSPNVQYFEKNGVAVIVFRAYSSKSSELHRLTVMVRISKILVGLGLAWPCLVLVIGWYRTFQHGLSGAICRVLYM